MTFPRSFGLVALAALALLAPTAAALTGPYAGAVAQGETDVHRYDNNPLKQPCVDMVTTYTVTLTYAPATGVLTLSAGGRTVTGSNGVATLSFQSGVCTAFSIAVTGTQVDALAAYAVTVTSGPGGSLGGGSWA